MPLRGFVNSGKLDRFECSELAFPGLLHIQQSFYLDDDLEQIASSLIDHPMVDYTEQEQGLSEQELVQRTWLRLAQSSVWLEKQQVFLAVTRIEFYTSGVKHWPRISFLRGQVYDQDWDELRNHTIHWQGEDIVFPRIFDIPIPYLEGDGFFGPEDPRVVIEEGVDGAEPVIVFNMISDLKERTRSMHIYRPFSGASVILTIEDQFVRPSVEKNWAPFFHPDLQHTDSSHKRYPSHFIHFVYDFRPFRILRCHLLNGWCKHIYDVVLSDSARHGGHPGRISGGTNFVPLRLSDDTISATYIGFPRTHMGAGCHEDAMYRPELMVLTAVEDQFHIDYLSGPIDFQDTVLWPAARDDPCGEGHILIANSVARWDRESDIMSLSLTVDDSTTQMMRIKGVRAHVEALPLWAGQRDGEGWSTIGQDVVGCSVQEAQYYAEEKAGPSNGTNLRKEREEAEKRRKEEAEEREKEREKEHDGHRHKHEEAEVEQPQHQEQDAKNNIEEKKGPHKHEKVKEESETEKKAEEETTPEPKTDKPTHEEQSRPHEGDPTKNESPDDGLRKDAGEEHQHQQPQHQHQHASGDVGP